jgi:CAAX prenyl protease-like protein
MSLASSISRYWRAARAPRHSLSFACPLLVAYETLAAALSRDSLTDVRNGADVMLKSVFVLLGGREGLLAFGALLVGTGVVLVWRDRRRSGPIEGRVLGLMLVESAVNALAFGLVSSVLTGLLLTGLSGAVHRAHLAIAVERMELTTQLMVSLGAGIYEELLFRVLLVGALAWAGRRVLGWSSVVAGIAATFVGALVFSACHYIGPYGDRLDLASFTFRTISGVLFSGLYLLRGFGIAAWTHALYDVFLSVALALR